VNIQFASQKKFITGTNSIMLFKEIIAVYLNNLTKNVIVQRGKFTNRVALIGNFAFWITKGHRFRLRFLQAGLKIATAIKTIFLQETYFLISLTSLKRRKCQLYNVENLSMFVCLTAAVISKFRFQPASKSLYSVACLQ
jgi:hypothetical protein